MSNKRKINNEMERILSSIPSDCALVNLEVLAACTLLDAVNKNDVTLQDTNPLLQRAQKDAKDVEEDPVYRRFEEAVKTSQITNKERAELIYRLMSSQSGSIIEPIEGTPDNILDIILGILKPMKEDRILDLGSGYGSFLFAADRYASDDEGNHPTVYGVELIFSLAFISEVLLLLEQADYQILQGDGLRSALSHGFTKAYTFPAMGIRYNEDLSDIFPEDLSKDIKGRSRSEWYFVFKALGALQKGGTMAALLPDGALFSASDAAVRKYLVEKNLIQGVISFPAGILNWTGVKTSLLLIGPSEGAFKMVDAAPFAKRTGRKVEIDAEGVLKAYYNKDVKTFCAEEAAERNYNLTLQAYADFDVLKSIDSPEKISDLAEIIVGSQYTLNHFKKDFSAERTDYQILASGNIEDGMIDYDNLQYIHGDEKLDKFDLHEGDVVITTKSTIVKTAVAAGIPDRHIIVTGGMLIVRPEPEKLNPTYLKMFLDSDIGKTLLRAIQKGSVITTISVPAFRNMEVSCPEIEKQNVLANKYNSMLAMYAGMKEQMEALKLKIVSLYDETMEEK